MAIFDMDNDDIKNLDELGLPKLVYQIMFYEIAKLNLLNQGLNISLNTKTGDGGSDGEFNNFNQPIPQNHKFLPNKNIVFQFKASEIGDKAWFKKEILNSGNLDLKPKLKELIENDYAYLLITNKTDLPAVKFDEKKRVLKEVFSDAGYTNVSVQIIGLAKLAEWANSIPQIYLNRNQDTKYFELFDDYEYEISQSSDNIEYVNDKKREDSIQQVRDEIDATLLNQNSSFIRVEGFSGIGKTRFIYESLNQERFKEFVLYVQSYNDDILGNLVSFCKMLPINSQELVIFVIDECPYEEHVLIYRSLKKYFNLVVITIDQVLSQQDIVNCKDEKRILLEGLDEARTVELIQNTNNLLNNDIARKIAYYTEGYPRLAFFMATYYDIEKGDIENHEMKSALLERILNSITKNPDAIKILQAISIFKLFPNTDNFKVYKDIIFKHFQIDLVTASITIDELSKKGIVRKAGRFLYISPRPISIHLFNKFLEIYDYDFIDDLFEKLNNESLMNGFFEKLQGIKFDTTQHKDLLFRILSKFTYEQLDTALGSQIFHSLCLKDKKYSISLLNKIFFNKSKKELLSFKEGRRYLIFSLDELISFNETFEDSAKLLFLLARAENESWSNNSKGIFIASFQLILSGTETNIVERLSLLRSLYLEYTEKDDRGILLNALENTYPKHNYMATHKNYPSMPENIPAHYEHSTEEINNYFEKLKELIPFIYENSSGELKVTIVNNLVHSLRMMMKYKQINTWLLDFIEKIIEEDNRFKTVLFEQVSSIMKYDKDKELSKNILSKLKKLNSKFVDNENIEEIKELFFRTDKYRYNSEENFEKHCSQIAKDIIATKNYSSILSKSNKNLHDLGRKVASIDKENILYKETMNLLPQLEKDSNIGFFTNYIFNSKIGEVSNHKKLFDEIYEKLVDKSLMFEFIHSSYKVSLVAANYLYELLKKKEIDSSILENLTYGFWLRDYKKNEFTKFIDKINSIIDNKSHSFNLCMQYLGESKDKKLFKKYALYYLENDIFRFSVDNVNKQIFNRINHELDTMTEKLLLDNFEFSESILEKIWQTVLLELNNNGQFEADNFGSIYKIIKKYSSFFWEKLKNKLDEVKPSTYPLYGNFVDFMQGGRMSMWFSHSIFDYTEVTGVIKWLKETEYEEARYLVADSFNIDFESDILPDIVIQILTVFPNDKRLYSSIQCRSESWSGSYVPIANEKIININTMLEKYKDNASVVCFLKLAKKYFEYKRDKEKIEDEERNI